MTVHLDMDHVRILIKPAAKTDATIKKEQN